MAYFPQQQGFKQPKRSFMDMMFGRPEQNYQQSLLGTEQQDLYQQMINAGKGEGAGGAFGQSADYYRDLLSDNPQDMQAFAAPEMRRFNQEIIPGLAEQFAGFGGGQLSGSGFRNAAVGAGTDLAERLGSIRAQLRMQGAQGLTGIGQMGLGQYNENVHRPETYGLAGGMAQGIGQGIGSMGAIGAGQGIGAFSNWLKPPKAPASPKLGVN